MKINEKTLLTFATSKPVDKEGYLLKRGEGETFLIKTNKAKISLSRFDNTDLLVSLPKVNKAFLRRWFVLKGNLLFYFERKGGELLGMIILEGCVIELAEAEAEKYCFNVNFLGNRTYVLSAETQDQLESWMRALTCAGFDYMRLMISELQRQLDEIDKTSPQSSLEPEYIPPVPPRRQNPFNKFNGM